MQETMSLHHLRTFQRDEIEAIYRETYSIISKQLMSKFTKKQFDRISELEKEKMNQLRN